MCSFCPDVGEYTGIWWNGTSKLRTRRCSAASPSLVEIRRLSGRVAGTHPSSHYCRQTVFHRTCLHSFHDRCLKQRQSLNLAVIINIILAFCALCMVLLAHYCFPSLCLLRVRLRISFTIFSAKQPLGARRLGWLRSVCCWRGRRGCRPQRLRR